MNASPHNSKHKPSKPNRPAEPDQLLSHEYDGIREYDNPMPKWWKWTFWATFYFSIGYFVHYHLTDNGPSVAATYEAELALAREQAALRAMGSEVNEAALAGLMSQSEMMTDAAKLFVQKCGPCHGNRGEGLIGPNLTDRFWLHGDAGLVSIYELIRDGVPTKGMPAWNRQLTPIELTKVAAFVGTLRGTDVPGPRGPEGNEVTVAPPGTPTANAPSSTNTPAQGAPEHASPSASAVSAADGN